jgi:hypothetical protein
MNDNTETLQTYPEISADQAFFIARDLVDEELVDAMWRELDGRVDRELIWRTACSVAERYYDASITTYIPIFIRRLTIELLTF